MQKRIIANFMLFIGLAGGVAALSSYMEKQKNLANEEINKYKDYFVIFCQWLEQKQKGKSLEEYFIKKGYHSIAIYGMGELGIRLFNELKDSCISIKYAIDQNTKNFIPGLKLVTPEEKMEYVDVIVVTVPFAFFEVKRMLSSKIECPIVSLEEVVFKV